MRFRIGFCVVYNLKRELIMDGGLIAQFYVRHDTFWLDFLAALPSIAEVMQCCYLTVPFQGAEQCCS